MAHLHCHKTPGQYRSQTMHWSHSQTTHWSHSQTTYWSHSQTTHWSHSKTTYWSHSQTIHWSHSQTTHWSHSQTTYWSHSQTTHCSLGTGQWSFSSMCSYHMTYDHQSPGSSAELILIGYDGIAHPPIVFTHQPSLFLFLECLENSLLPRGSLEPPLWYLKTQGRKVSQTQDWFSY